MSKEEQAKNQENQAQEAEQNNASLQVIREYVKDLSFEVPTLHDEITDPNDQTLEIIVDPSMSPGKEDGVYEVTIYCQAKVASEKDPKKHTFLMELRFSGLFHLVNIPKEHHQAICLVDCAHLLFPSVRMWVSSVTSAGGFPPVRMPPSFDFRGLLEQKLAAAQSKDKKKN